MGRHEWMEGARDARTLLGVVTRYYVTAAPHVRLELSAWRRRARRIPDPMLRAFALEKLDHEHLNSEAAAVFATLVPLRHRRMVVRLAVAFEVMYDYLDSVSEQRVPDPVANGLHLHQALTAALTPPLRPIDYYLHNPQRDDGGYLDALATACRTCFVQLPRADAVRPVALRAAARCGEGQTRTHAVSLLSTGQLATWSAGQAPESGYAWWELAAGAASSLAMHALFAAAGDVRTTPADSARIEAAYFPAVCSLSTLLDSLIDYERDKVERNHGYIAYYATNLVAAERLSAIAREGERGVRSLRHAGRHAAIATGVAGFYLSADGARSGYAAPVAARIVGSLSPAMIRPVLAILRVKRGWTFTMSQAAGFIRALRVGLGATRERVRDSRPSGHEAPRRRS